MLHEMDIPHLDQYFGVWAMHEEVLRAAVDRINQINLDTHMAARKKSEPPQQSAMNKTEDGIAVVELSGTLMKFVGSLQDGTSTVFTRRLIRQAADDPDVRGILLHVDSPGGTVSGTGDLADDIAAANKKKPVVSYIEDLGASAAYWIASQAGQVFANKTALVGSIGTFAVVSDYSAYAAKEGIKVHVVRAGEYKGAGEPGTEVTPRQLENWQRTVNELNNVFLGGVAGGRKLSPDKVKELADGRVHIAAEALALGLIDGIATFDKSLATLRQTIKTNLKNSKESSMSEQSNESAETKNHAKDVLNPAPSVATIDDLKAACGGADAEFLVSCLEKKFTIQQAKDAWIDRLVASNKAKDEELAKAKEKAAKSEPSKFGVPPMTSRAKASDESFDDPISAWDQAVAEKMKTTPNKAKAISAITRENPELHEAYLQAYNERHASAARNSRR